MDYSFYGYFDLDPVQQTLSLKFPDGTNVPIVGGKPAIYYLDPTNGSDSNNGLSVSQAFKTLPVAYAA